MPVTPRPQDATAVSAAADTLGVDLTDLVKLRRRLGTATKHRRPTLIDRLFRRG